MQKLIRKLPKRFANCELRMANLNPVMYVHILLFWNICLLTYFHIKNICMCSSGKRYLPSTCLKLKPLLAVKSTLDDFAICQNANLFVHEKWNNLPPRNFLYTFRKESFARKKMINLKELQTVSIYWFYLFHSHAYISSKSK